MTTMSATAVAHPNIAFIKYWGNRDDTLRLPVNPSISMNLDGLQTETTVTWTDALTEDRFTLNGKAQSNAPLARVTAHLDVLRQRLSIRLRAEVVSGNNFPTGAIFATKPFCMSPLSWPPVLA